MTAERPQDLDVPSILRVIRRAALPIVAAALCLAALTFVYASSRPAMYLATASLSALPVGSGNSVINSTLVTAPPLPPAVVQRALRSPEVVRAALKRLETARPDSPERRSFAGELRREFQLGDPRSVQLGAEINQDFVGVYEISALAPTPELAQGAANSFQNALLEWDRQRALTGIARARTNLTNQRADLNARIARGGDPIGVRTLEQLRLDVVERLQQVEVLEQTVSGTLSRLAAASLPVQSAQPRPVRDALLVAAASVFFGLLIAFVLDQLQKKIRGLDDLRSFGPPVFGTLPPLTGRRSDPVRIGQATRHGLFREQMEFVRVGLMSSLAAPDRSGTQTPAVMVSSARVGEGKSTVTAGLAYSLATHGTKVLIVDADVFRRRQEQLWLPTHSASSRKAVLRPDEGHEPSHLYPEVAENVDLLTFETQRLDAAALGAEIRRRSRDYGIVLVDSAPVLKVADTLVLASHLDGLMIVADPQTSYIQMQRILDETSRLGVQLLGFVLNRSREATVPGEYAYSMPLKTERSLDVHS
ncbi:P-loop NTPase [Deinococcus frigens]|uniref:P-loop NTPase n=1 Tax=Deinococcus frigens TaxID=249403 RepID=UPI000494E045|nr:P-loop NTPase [Deinococcus frigens]